ncbi:MAG: helix-turn-helix transcriptional regulator [Cytophagales bacterium]|nr:helix-turn-helix transcriptional regulator [Armatimonadota bacterium]
MVRPTVPARGLTAEACEVTAVDTARVAALRTGNLCPTDALRLGEIFAALGEPNRLRILEALARARSLCVCDLCALLELRQSNVSHQLRLLRALRLVRAERSGRNVFYSLDDSHVRGLIELGLEHVREATG